MKGLIPMRTKIDLSRLPLQDIFTLRDALKVLKPFTQEATLQELSVNVGTELRERTLEQAKSFGRKGRI